MVVGCSCYTKESSALSENQTGDARAWSQRPGDGRPTESTNVTPLVSYSVILCLDGLAEAENGSERRGDM